MKPTNQKTMPPRLDSDLKVATLWVVLSMDRDQAGRMLARCFPKSAREVAEQGFGLVDWHFSFDLTYLPKDDVTLLWDRKKKDFSVLFSEMDILSEILPAGFGHEILLRNGEASRPTTHGGEFLRIIMGGTAGWDWEIGLGVKFPSNGLMVSLAKINLWDVFVHLSSDLERPLNLPNFTLSSDSDDEADIHLVQGEYFTLRMQLRQAWLPLPNFGCSRPAAPAVRTSFRGDAGG
jgi:hypothetical protein